MSAKTSVEVVRSEKSCHFLLSALLEHGTMVAAILLGRAQLHLEEGENPPDFFSPIRALARILRASLLRLVTADETLYAANAALGILRIKRDNLADQLGKKIVRFRQVILGHYVQPELEILGLQSPTNRQPGHLLRQSDRISSSFQLEKLEDLLGETNFAEAPDVRSQAAELDPIALELRETLQQVDVARRAHDNALVNRDKVKKEHGNLFIHTARTFEAQCRIADEHELADRVRPSIRRPGLTLEDEREEDDPSGDTSSQTSDSDPAATSDSDPAATSDSDPAVTGEASA